MFWKVNLLGLWFVWHLKSKAGDARSWKRQYERIIRIFSSDFSVYLTFDHQKREIAIGAWVCWISTIFATSFCANKEYYISYGAQRGLMRLTVCVCRGGKKVGSACHILREIEFQRFENIYSLKVTFKLFNSLPLGKVYLWCVFKICCCCCLFQKMVSSNMPVRSYFYFIIGMYFYFSSSSTAPQTLKSFVNYRV